MYQSDVRTMHHVITFASPYYTMLRYIMLCAVTYIDLVKRMVTLTSTSLSLINYRYDDQATAAAKVLKILTIIMVVGRALTMDCKFLSSSSYWPSWGGHWSACIAIPAWLTNTGLYNIQLTTHTLHWNNHYANGQRLWWNPENLVWRKASHLKQLFQKISKHQQNQELLFSAPQVLIVHI